jgi:hypothetical protein
MLASAEAQKAMAAKDGPGRRKLSRSALAAWLGLISLQAAPPAWPENTAASLEAAGPSSNQAKQAEASPTLPRGNKLMLKDGSFQLVREYQIAGDRVRYYSLDSSQWEEMPAELVDWDKTKSVAAEEAKRDAAAVSKVKSQEAARQAEMLDIDASVEAAPGIFLPPGEGLFAFDGKSVLKLAQAPIDSKLSKKNAVERVFVPIPIVPTRHNISIHRPHAEYRITNGQPEFYLRLAGGPEPELELIRATVRGDTREIERLDELFGEQKLKKDALPLQRWVVAPGLYRFTLGTPLGPGEYVLAEAVQDNGLNLYVWDFGVDAGRGAASTKPK